MKIGNLDYLFHLYYGPTLHDTDLSYQIMQYDRGFSGNPYESLGERTFSLDAQPQEFSTQQQGDFRTTSIEVVNGDGSYSFSGKAGKFSVTEGKYRLETLPTVFANKGNTVQSLTVTLTDSVSGVDVILLYSVFEEADIINGNAKILFHLRICHDDAWHLNRAPDSGI